MRTNDNIIINCKYYVCGNQSLSDVHGCFGSINLKRECYMNETQQQILNICVSGKVEVFGLNSSQCSVNELNV